MRVIACVKIKVVHFVSDNQKKLPSYDDKEYTQHFPRTAKNDIIANENVNYF